MYILKFFLFTIFFFFFEYSTVFSQIKFDKEDMDIALAIQGKRKIDFTPKEITEFKNRLKAKFKTDNSNSFIIYLEFLKWLRRENLNDLTLVKEAIQVCNLGLKNNPKNINLLYKRGLWLETNNEKIKANEDYKKVNSYLNSLKITVNKTMSAGQIDNCLAWASIYYVIDNVNQSTIIINKLYNYYPNNKNVVITRDELQKYKERNNRKLLIRKSL